MTDEHLTHFLAERVMGWTVGPDRFMTGKRGWIPRWRFQPAEKLEDAFRLLQEAAPLAYSICGDDQGNLHVKVSINGAVGEARGRSIPAAVTYAVAYAFGVKA